MALRYDFDMFSIVPKDLQEQARKLGLPAETVGEQIALWRDPEVVNVLRGADPVVQEFFLESGFGLNVYDSGAPSGKYPAYDEVARIGVIERLTENMNRFDLANANFNGFDFSAFLDYVVTAEPWDEPGQGLPQADAKSRAIPATFGPAEEIGRGGAASMRQTHEDGSQAAASGKSGFFPAFGVAAAFALYLVIWQGASIMGLTEGLVTLDSAELKSFVAAE